jgi:SAM-dependent methyltransferase
MSPEEARPFGSYGEESLPTGRIALRDWLILRRLLRAGAPYRGKRLVDIGCGYYAQTTRQLRTEASSTVLVDASISEDLKSDPKIRVIEARLPEAMNEIDDRSVDVLVCSAVLEHLREPFETLRHFPRVLAPGGMALINVPSWAGKRPLEFVAFRLGLSTDEMNDHEMYYDPRDLWPLLVRAGFRPRNIRCKKHWLRFNTLAVCRQDDSS